MVRVFEKLCEKAVACNTSYMLNQPTFPVVIDVANTGASGVACVGCSISNPWSVVSASNTDFARVATVVDALAVSTITVVDPFTTYPAGTAAGFLVRDVNTIAKLDLFGSLTIRTFNNGVAQESRSAGNLLDLKLLINFVGGSNPPYNAGFITTKPFDEIRIEVRSLASAINVVDVFGAFVDTRTTVIEGILCSKTNPDVNVTHPGILTSGNVSTNDKTTVGTTYGTAIADAGNPNSNIPTIASNGSYTFQTNLPGVYVFEVPVCFGGDGNGCDSETLTITVLDSDILTNPPVANTDIASVKGTDTGPAGSVLVDVKANDGPGNVGGTLGNPTIDTQGEHGTAVIEAGKIRYTPNVGFYGEDIVIYEICESPSGQCRTAKLVVTVLASDAPNSITAADDYMSTPKNTLLTVTAAKGVLANDTDPDGNTLTVTAQNTPTSGVGTLDLTTTGSYTFTPATGYSGPASFVYQVCDGVSGCKNGNIVHFG